MKLFGQKEQVRLQKDVVSTSIFSTNRANKPKASLRLKERLKCAGSILKPFLMTAAIERVRPCAIRCDAETRVETRAPPPSAGS
jgi:hypothetical protein